jgi:hypothetical protein
MFFARPSKNIKRGLQHIFLKKPEDHFGLTCLKDASSVYIHNNKALKSAGWQMQSLQEINRRQTKGSFHSIMQTTCLGI